MRGNLQPRLPFPSSVEISVSRAMKMLNCRSRATVYKLLERGSIEGYQICMGGWWRIYYDSVVSFLHLRKGIVPGQESRREIGVPAVAAAGQNGA